VPVSNEETCCRRPRLPHGKILRKEHFLRNHVRALRSVGVKIRRELQRERLGIGDLGEAPQSERRGPDVIVRDSPFATPAEMPAYSPSIVFGGVSDSSEPVAGHHGPIQMKSPAVTGTSGV